MEYRVFNSVRLYAVPPPAILRCNNELNHLQSPTSRCETIQFASRCTTGAFDRAWSERRNRR